MFACLIIIFGTTSCTCERKNQSRWDGISVHLSKEPNTLDWHKATDIPSRTVILAFMATLTEYEFEGAKPVLVPGLAASWRSNVDATKWTFTLRENVKWSDGKDFVAEQVVHSFRRFLKPETAAFNSYYFYGVKGAEDFNQGKLSDFNEVGIKAKDSLTVEFSLRRPMVHFPQLLALYNTAPWREDLPLEGGHLLARKDLPSLGPFVISEVKQGEWIRFHKNDNFYGRVKAEGIEFRIISEPTTALNLFTRGQLDIVTELPEAEKTALKDQPFYKEVTELSIEYLGFNLKSPPFNRLEVRRKLKAFTDPGEIVKLLNSGERQNYGFVPEGVGPALEPRGSILSPNEMQKEDLRFTLTFPSEPRQKRVAQVLQAQWEKAPGWTVELEPQDWKVFLSRVNSVPPAVYRIGWMAIFPDPILFLSLWTSDSHYNTSGWKSEEYDRLVDRIEGETQATKRERLVLQAMEVLNKEVIAIPLYRGSRQELVKENLKGYNPNSLNRPHWSKIYRHAL